MTVVRLYNSVWSKTTPVGLPAFPARLDIVLNFPETPQFSFHPWHIETPVYGRFNG